MAHFYILMTVLLTVYGQLVLKWRIGSYGPLPESFSGKLGFLFGLLFDPFIFSGLIAALIAAFFWMAAMTTFDVSYAYPFVSGAFVLVFLFSVFLFGEPVTWQKIVGLVLIVAGIIVTSRSI